MKILRKTLLTTTLLAVFSFIPSVEAASDDDCSIWLCLPMGFPSGCGDAKKAFKKRIKNFKSPLPSLSSCLLKGGDIPKSENDVSSQDGKAAYIPERTICTKYESKRDGGEWRRYCVSQEVIPAHAIKDRFCVIDKQNNHSPAHCSHTIRYVDVYMDGEFYGETHYFDNKGNEYDLP